ncbi:MAG: molybdopterin-dependent oxidoreductase [Microthrixaceae bacterium]
MSDVGGALPSPRFRGGARWSAALSGAVAAATALAAGELTTAVAGSPTSPVLAVGARFVDRFAGSLKDFAVAVFGTSDKAATVTGIVVLCCLLGALIGVAALRRPRVVWAFAPFAAAGLWAQAVDRRGSIGAAVTAALLGSGVGMTTCRRLVGLVRSADRHVVAAPQDAPGVLAGRIGVPARRRFLVEAGAATAGAASITVLGSALRRDDVVAKASTIALPDPGSVGPIPDPVPGFDTSGISSFLTPNRDFYRIDTSLSAPRVDAGSWRLRIDGLVREPIELSYRELLALPSVEETITIGCVSNEVGGGLVGNARWQGVPLRSLLDRVGVRRGAEQVFSTSVDGWTSGFPLELVDDRRPVLVAYAMNGARLPVNHGFPARLVVAGLYGYVSATKWIERIELTTWADRDGYWVPLGWSKRGPVKLASRIDTPRQGSTVASGDVAIGGVAWRPAVGVSAVEVSIDDGPWQRAQLGEATSEYTWVQWRIVRELSAGRHTVAVRAVDNRGRVQDPTVRPPDPDGATGLHRVSFRVRKA